QFVGCDTMAFHEIFLVPPQPSRQGRARKPAFHLLGAIYAILRRAKRSFLATYEPSILGPLTTKNENDRMGRCSVPFGQGDAAPSRRFQETSHTVGVPV